MSNKRISMTNIKQILRLNEEGYSKRKISSMLCIHRDTVSKYIVLAKTMDMSVNEMLQASDRELEALFSAKETPPDDRYEHLQSLLPHIESELSRKHVTRELLWEEYKEKYPGGYSQSRFNEYVRNWLKKSDAYMHIEHKAGDKVFVDFTGDHLYFTDRQTGDMTSVEVFIAVLGASQMTYVEACKSQKKEDFITAVENAFIYYGGVPAAIVPDNLKSAVHKSSKYEAELNKDFENFALHYNTVVIPARSRKPRDKALVENAVKIVYQRIFASLRNRVFFTLDDLNEAIWEELDKYNTRTKQGYNYSRYDKFKNIEQKELKQLPSERYVLKDYAVATVYKNCHIYLSCDKHYYSVPYKYIGQKVQIVYSKRSVEIYFKHERIAVHKRDYNLYQYTTTKDHMPSHHQFVSDWHPDKFIKWASDTGYETEQYIRKIFETKQHPEQAYKSCIGILKYAKSHGKPRLNKACKRAMFYNSYSYKTIKNILDKNLDQAEIETSKQERLPLHENIRGGSYYN